MRHIFAQALARGDPGAHDQLRDRGGGEQFDREQREQDGQLDARGLGRAGAAEDEADERAGKRHDPDVAGLVDRRDQPGLDRLADGRGERLCGSGRRG